MRTSRRHHRLIGLHASIDADGEPLVDGLPWRSPEVLSRVQAAAGDDAELARYDGPERFDILPYDSDATPTTVGAAVFR